MDKQNVVCPHNRILLSHTKEGNSDPHYNTDEPSNIRLGEISQTHKEKFCMIPLCEEPRIDELTETGSRLEVLRGWRVGGKKGKLLLLTGDTVSVQEDKMFGNRYCWWLHNI